MHIFHPHWLSAYSLEQSLYFGNMLSYVSRVFKKGDKANPKNYHPILLTSVLLARERVTIVSGNTENQNVITQS